MVDSNRSRFPLELWDGWTMNPERSIRGVKNFNVDSDPDYYDWNRIRDEVLAMQRTMQAGVAPESISGDTALTDTATSRLVLANASSGPVQVTLPDPAIQGSLPLHVKKIDSSGNTVTIVPNGSETIDGESSLIINTQWASAMLVSDGSNWYIL